MKINFRILALLLCLVLTLISFTACGGNNDDTTADSATTEEATEPVVIELGAVIDKVYTIVEINSTQGTCLALLFEDENSYRDETYTQGREYNITTHEQVSEVTYTRDSRNRLTKTVYADPKTNDIIKIEEYAYTADGRPQSSATRDAQGLTLNSVTYTYNTDSTYTVTTSENAKLVSIVTYDRNDTVLSRIDYEYKNDGSYNKRSYEDGKLTTFASYDFNGNETSRAEYTYNPDGSFTVKNYENGTVKNEQAGTVEEVVTQPAETTTAAESVTLDTNTIVTVPTTAPSTTNNNSDTTSTTNKNNNNNNNNGNGNNNNNTTTRPATTTTPTTTQPATDASGNIDMLAQSRIFRSGEYYFSGVMDTGTELSKMTIAVTPKTMYASIEMDFGEMMGMGSTGASEFGFLQAADGNYYLLESATKTCCLLDESAMAMIGGEGEEFNPEDLFGDINLADAFIKIDKNAQPDNTEKTSLNGKAVTCYTFNAANGDFVKHYVDNQGNLVRIEDYELSGQMINCLDIDRISGDVATHMKQLPSDYTKTNLYTFLIGLLGDNSSTIV